MKNKLVHQFALGLIAVGIMACGLSKNVTGTIYPNSQSPTHESDTPSIPTAVVSPTILAITSEAGETPVAIETPENIIQTPTVGQINPTTTTAPGSALAKSYSVVFMTSDGSLALQKQPGINQVVAAKLAYNSTGLVPTGKTSQIDQEDWIEVQTQSGETGWVKRYYLTEEIDSSAFCSDARVTTLINELAQVWNNQNAKELAELVSPIHGLSVQYLRGGTLANYDREEISWLFKSDYQMKWGIHPGSGMEVVGTFNETVLPKIIEVFNADPEMICGDMKTGGTTYAAAQVDRLINFKLMSLYKPGSEGIEMDWQTWLVGIEYVDGAPYLVSLTHFAWEP